MSIVGVAIQQPSEILDYDIDYEEFFLDDDGNPNGDFVTLAEASFSPAGTLNVNPVVVSGGQLVKVWIQGGLDKEEYVVTILATTDAGRKKESEIRVRIKESQ